MSNTTFFQISFFVMWG